MFIDTHCHINMMVKKKFDVLLQAQDFPIAKNIIQEAKKVGVTSIINVGTSLIESQNCVTLAEKFDHNFAAVGIHPNDCTQQWQQDFEMIVNNWFKNNKNKKVVAIGECGIDRHYPDYNLSRQTDAFKAHIELALEQSLPLIVHTRDAADETLSVLQMYKNDPIKGVIHCFSEKLDFALEAQKINFVIGIGGTITYPKNEYLRDVVRTMPLESIILETDAPFLPIQSMRGKQNHPQYIPAIAQYIADLKQVSQTIIAQTTTQTAIKLFDLDSHV